MLQAVLSGILVGSIYGLFSMGFSLAFGVMRIVNFAHGEMVMIGMYIGYVLFTTTGLDPFLAIPIAMLGVGGIGAVLYQFAYRRFVGHTTLQQLLVAIALALVLQVCALLIFGPDARAVRTSWGGHYLLVGSIFLSYAQIAAAGVAITLIAVVEITLRTTLWGQAVRAIADDRETAELVGISSNRVNITAFAFSCALAGAAGAVLVSYYPVNPVVGFSLMPIAMIATVLGGLGSVGGAFAGGLLCGVIQQLTSALISPALQDLPLYLLFLLFLAFRPYGLLGRQAAH
jgi:branched-chain amino acid transport system permease protein